MPERNGNKNQENKNNRDQEIYRLQGQGHVCLEGNGAVGRDRTGDLYITNVVLLPTELQQRHQGIYPLSEQYGLFCSDLQIFP